MIKRIGRVGYSSARASEADPASKIETASKNAGTSVRQSHMLVIAKPPRRAIARLLTRCRLPQFCAAVIYTHDL
jgi:hypothetical protein